MARWLLPEGISDVLPTEAQHVEHLRRALLDLYRSYGYELVIPPLIEYLDSLLTGTGRDLDLRTFKLVDQLSGRQLGLRADITPQTARIDAHILNRKGVVRLCYAGSVLHTRPAHALATRQPIQVGAELYGHAGLEADVEIHRLALESLQRAGVAGVRFDIGHTGIVRALLAADRQAQERADEILAALSAKDLPALRQLLGGVSAEIAGALGALVQLNGPVEAVLQRARSSLPALPGIGKALDDLAFVAQRVTDAAVGVDLSDLHGYRYYTGVNFAAYTQQAPAALLRGGRYDDIGRAFGRARPATGFSIDLRELTRARVAEQSPSHSAILAPKGEEPELLAMVRALRTAGEVVVQQLDAGQHPDGIEFDREIRRIDGRWQVTARTAPTR